MWFLRFEGINMGDVKATAFQWVSTICDVAAKYGALVAILALLGGLVYRQGGMIEKMDATYELAQDISKTQVDMVTRMALAEAENIKQDEEIAKLFNKVQINISAITEIEKTLVKTKL